MDPPVPNEEVTMSDRVEIPHLQHIVARQLHLWETEQRARAERERRAPPEGGPYLTLSREPGSGGHALGLRLAQRLGWEFYDRNLLEHMAQEARVDPVVLERLERGPHNRLHDAIVLSLDRSYPGHHGYLKQLVALVTSLCARGRVVLLGRGAHLVLPPERGLRLRLIAPLEQRVARVARTRNCTRSEAEAWIHRTDENQTALIRNILRRDLDDPADYDVVLNRAHLSRDAAERCVLELLERKLGATQAWAEATG